MAARKTFGGSSLSFSLQNDAISSSNEAFDALLMPNSSSSFTGMTSMVNFEDVCGRNNTQPQGMSFYRPHDQEENGDDDMDDFLRHPEKKRRLSVDQVQFLERSFAVDNKLEPERKIQLAKDLGLHPRQVAIWFQNRRARWKTKQLEKDYEELKGSYDSLKSNYEKLLKEKEKLEAEVLSLRQPELQKENVNGPSSGPMDEPPQLESQPKPVSEKQASELVIVKCKQEDLSSTNSGVFDSDSPNYPDAIRPSLLEPAAVTSHARELDQSDLSQDEEDNLSKSLGRPAYNFPKLEYPVYVDQSATCGSYDFPVEEQTFWFWSCTE